MNHDITNTEREETKHLVDKESEMNKQEHMGEWFFNLLCPQWEKKISKDPEGELTVDHNNVTYQYTKKGIS